MQGDTTGRQGRTRHASAALARALRLTLDPCARRRGFAAATLFAEWSLIVGPVLARRCQPARLEPGRSARSIGGTLVLHAGGGAALELQHAMPQLIERINAHYGFKAVRQVRLVQAPLPPAPAPERPLGRALASDEEVDVQAAVAAVTEAGLRGALAGLGRAIRATRPAQAAGCEAEPGNL